MRICEKLVCTFASFLKKNIVIKDEVCKFRMCRCEVTYKKGLKQWSDSRIEFLILFVCLLNIVIFQPACPNTQKSLFGRNGWPFTSKKVRLTKKSKKIKGFFESQTIKVKVKVIWAPNSGFDQQNITVWVKPYFFELFYFSTLSFHKHHSLINL